MVMNWTCEQIEERLSDYIERALDAAETQQLEAHLLGCEHCAALTAQLRLTMGGLHALEMAEPPAHLVDRILEQTSGPQRRRTTAPGLLNWLRPLFRPQIMLGTVAALASLLVTLQFAIPARYRKNGFTPTEVFESVNRQAHISYGRSLKFVNDLRVVYEIQSRLRPDSAPAVAPERPEENPGRAAPQGGSNDQSRKNDQKPHSAYRTETWLAVSILPDVPRSEP
jgi:hypothetical protein